MGANGSFKRSFMYFILSALPHPGQKIASYVPESVSQKHKKARAESKSARALHLI